MGGRGKVLRQIRRKESILSCYLTTLYDLEVLGKELWSWEIEDKFSSKVTQWLESGWLKKALKKKWVR